MAAGTASEDDERMKRLLREVLRSEGHFLDAAESRGARLDRFMVKRNGKSEFIRAADVDWIESDGNYVRLHVGPQSHLVRGTVVTCADRLDARQFVRIHRRFIINIDRVKEVQPWFGGDHVIVLTSGQRLRLSRNFREHFQSRMVGD